MASPTPVEFREISDEKAWDRLVASQPLVNVYCSWVWGEYKKLKGWKILRVAFFRPDSNDLLGIGVVQCKRILVSHVYVIQGGPLLIESSEAIGVSVIQQLTEFLQLTWRDLLLITNLPSGSEAVQRALLVNGFSPVMDETMYSLELELAGGVLALQKNLTSNWRHNLRRAINKHGLTCKQAVSHEERARACKNLAQMYRGLVTRKSFAPAIDIKLAEQFVVLDPHFVIVEVLDGKEVVAVRIGYLGGQEMTDFLTASSEGAKKNYANYLAVWGLIEISINKGMKRFECGGIDPAGNTGVYNFKKGLGAHLTTSGPLWCYSKTEYLKKAFVVLRLFKSTL